MSSGMVALRMLDLDRLTISSIGDARDITVLLQAPSARRSLAGRPLATSSSAARGENYLHPFDVFALPVATPAITSNRGRDREGSS